MKNITIKNVPDSIIRNFGTILNYEEIDSSFLPKKKQKNIYIESEECKNSEYEIFNNIEELVEDLQKYKN